MTDTYKCAVCDETFEKGWTDEEALAEKDAMWGAVSTDDCDIVCDDCFKKMGLGDLVEEEQKAERDAEERRRLEAAEMERHFQQHPHG